MPQIYMFFLTPPQEKTHFFAYNNFSFSLKVLKTFHQGDVNASKNLFALN